MVYQTYGGMNNTNSMSSEQNRKIFLGGLSLHTTDETLRTFCSRFGNITDCLVMRNAEGKPRGFGFVTFEDISSVEDFMHARPHTIDERQIDPKRAMPREDQNSSEAHLSVKKLFIAGLRDGINEDNLRQYFSRFGNITEVTVMKDREGKPRGFAFVSFDDYDAVDKAILEKPHLVNGKTLDVKKAVPKETSAPTGTSFNRNKPSNYSTPAAQNNFESMRDNFSGSTWNNQPQTSGYNSNGLDYNPPNNNGYQPSYNSMGQNQPSPSQQPLMNYNPNMSFNNNANQAPTSNYMPPSPYGYNSQQGFGGMNNPLQANGGGYNNNNGSNSSTPFNNSNSYGNIPQTYDSTDGNFNNKQQSRGGGPMRGGQGACSGFNGNNTSSNYGNRSAPYSTRGGSSNYNGRGRGRGRGQ